MNGHLNIVAGELCCLVGFIRAQHQLGIFKINYVIVYVHAYTDFIA